MQRSDLLQKVTGEATYCDDLTLPGMLYAALVRSPVSHGLIRGTDTSEALASPDVISVTTGADEWSLPRARIGGWVLDQPLLAQERVRYAGEPVAAVVATSQQAAEQAAMLVYCDIEPMEALPSIDAALAAQVEPLHRQEYVHAHTALPIAGVADEPISPFSNVCYRSVFEGGDVEALMETAAWIHDETYRFPAVAQMPLEPYAVMASWQEDDALQIWSSTQEPFKIREDLARLFDLSPAKIRVRVPFVGGGFGAKNGSKYEPLTAALARNVKRPVKLTLGLEDTFLTSSRHESVVRVRTGISSEGRMVAREVFTDLNAGAYAGSSPRVCAKTAYRAIGPYRFDAFRSVARAIYTNRLPAGSARGFGTPQVAWATETAIDEIALELGRDPADYRGSHFIDDASGYLLDSSVRVGADLRSGLAAVAERRPAKRGELEGFGFATGVKDGGGVASVSEASVGLRPDGQLVITSSKVEMGQGTVAMLTEIGAREMRCRPGRITVLQPDTRTEVYDSATNASRSTVFSGNAVLDACRKLRSEIDDRLAARLDVAPASWRLCGGDVVVDEHERVSLGELFEYPESGRDQYVATERSTYRTQVDLSSRLGHKSPFFEVSHGAAHVRIDPETGEIALLEYISAADVGHAVNRSACIGQDEGAVMMGVGHTMMEHLSFDSQGALMNGNLADYEVPRMRNYPQSGVETILIENGDGPGPYGAKGASEGGVLPVAPAIGNAVFDACGIRIRSLPMSPMRVWQLLREERRGGSVETA